MQRIQIRRRDGTTRWAVIGDNGDPFQVMEDGESLVVPLMWTDEIRSHMQSMRDGQPRRLHDGLGRPAGMTRGYVFGDFSDADQKRVQDAYERAKIRERNAWRGDNWAPAEDGTVPKTAEEAYEAAKLRERNAWRGGR